jgi:hypothetical protein
MARNMVKKRRGTEPVHFQCKVTQQKYFREEIGIQAQDSAHEALHSKKPSNPHQMSRPLPFAFCPLGPFVPMLTCSLPKRYLGDDRALRHKRGLSVRLGLRLPSFRRMSWAARSGVQRANCTNYLRYIWNDAEKEQRDKSER